VVLLSVADRTLGGVTAAGPGGVEIDGHSMQNRMIVPGVRGDDPIDGGLVDEGLARRLKALACTAPLHDLDSRKARLDWADASVYQMAEIALQIIDQVTIAMDFDRGADHE
jgi:hypothetical protein